MTVRPAEPSNWRGPSDSIRPADPGSAADLARILRSGGRDGQARMLLRLDPPELGQVRIDVRMHEQTMTVRMETQTQAGHDALQSRLGELKNALEQQGVHVQQMEVEHRPPVTTGSPQEQAWSHQQGTPQEGAGFGQAPGQRSNPRTSGPAESAGGDAVMGEGATFDAPTGATHAPWYTRQVNLVA